MYIGIGNTYAIMPLVKLVIQEVTINFDTNPILVKSVLGSRFSVLFNPQSYKISRFIQPGKGKEGDKEYVPFKAFEIMDMELFVDTFQSGAEIYGLDFAKPFTDPLKFTANSILPSPLKFLDASDYADKIYDLSRPDPNKHRPPYVRLEWNSLRFYGMLGECSKEYEKFNESGMPVRIKLKCRFYGLTDKEALMISGNPFNSPDTSKFTEVKQGDSLWNMALGAYSDAAEWRQIAAANGIVNPRLLSTGDTLVMPALP